MITEFLNAIRERRRKNAIKNIIEQYYRILDIETRQRQKTELFKRLEERMEELERRIKQAGQIEDKQKQLAELKIIIDAEKRMAKQIEKEMKEIDDAEIKQKKAVKTLKKSTR